MTVDEPQVVRVESASAAYDVRVGAGQLADAGPTIRTLLPRARRAVLIADNALPPILAESVAIALGAAGLETRALSAFAGEEHKTLDQAAGLLAAMEQHNLQRSDAVIALGGGSVGDLAGFCAGIHRRGVAFINCPTTLLGMVDAAIGGKTGVNIRTVDRDGKPVLSKNAAGTFHHPALVIADTATLDSLPQREFRAGLAECVKHALIAATPLPESPPLPSETPDALLALAMNPRERLTTFIARQVAIKARFVRIDERETMSDAEGGRALLNLGHTFAHAIETLPGIGLLHGEAVALGLVAAAHAGVALRTTDAALPGRVTAVLRAVGLPTSESRLPAAAELIERMTRDKKGLSGAVRVIVPEILGTARVVRDPPIAAIEAGWAAIRG